MAFFGSDDVQPARSRAHRAGNKRKVILNLALSRDVSEFGFCGKVPAEDAWHFPLTIRWSPLTPVQQPDPAEVATALADYGLILRGGFNFASHEAAPPGPTGAPARSVLLVGQAGDAPWPHFLRWREAQPADTANPLDAWSREVIDAAARQSGARPVYPSQKPYLPFQQWAMRAEGLKPSPLGILMHPEYGLWHAYRGALLFDAEIPIQAPREVIHLCDLCPGKPCLKSCPVDAYSDTGFAYEACLDHVRGPSGESCRTGGCLDRNACPYGTAYRYRPEAQAFHMAAFIK